VGDDFETVIRLCCLGCLVLSFNALYVGDDFETLLQNYVGTGVKNSFNALYVGDDFETRDMYLVDLFNTVCFQCPLCG